MDVLARTRWLCECRETGSVATGIVGGECPDHGGDACLRMVEYVRADTRHAGVSDDAWKALALRDLERVRRQRNQFLERVGEVEHRAEQAERERDEWQQAHDRVAEQLAACIEDYNEIWEA